jgi:two-component system alkaline phosphatase synthesis response regulator PhoP/two-component system response regulator VicR
MMHRDSTGDANASATSGDERDVSEGQDVAEMVRRDEILADIPVIMLTARAEDVSVAQGYTSGTDLYLTKPFNPTELLQFVRRILG